MQRAAIVPLAAVRRANAARLAPLAGAHVRFYTDAGFRMPRRRERVPPNIGFTIVPQQKAYIVERLGKYHATLSPGFHFLIPFFDRIAYIQSLKEEAITIPGQTAITRDNVTLQIDGVLYLRTLDPYAASYGVEDAYYALTQLAQTTMRSELGKITLDKTFEERESLNHAIVESINSAASNWGVQILRYEIKDISPPASVKAAMDLQAEAERRKRAEILDSEGQREAAINRAEGARRSTVLAAQGEAEAILARAKASASAVQLLAGAVTVPGGPAAVSLRVAEQYVAAFGRLAKAGNTVVLPANAGDVPAMVTSALATYGAIAGRLPGGGALGITSGASAAAAAAPAPEDVGASDPLVAEAIDNAAAAAAGEAGHHHSSSHGGKSGSDADADLAAMLAGLKQHTARTAAAAGASPSAPGAAHDGGERFVPKPF